jgi:restriction system protein
MPIPKYDELTWPMLEILRDGQPRSTHELARALADKFNLTDDERNAVLPSGVQTYMLNRTGWAGFHLDTAGLVTRPKRGVWQITPAGLKVLEGLPQKLDRHALLQFEPFKAYMESRARTRDREQGAEVSESAANLATDSPPEEVMANAFKTLRTSLKDELLALVQSMEPIRFERVVLDLLLAMGYGGSREEAAQMTKLSHDEGIDGVINEDRLGLDVIYIQAKRWQNTVGRKEIQSFVGALAGQQAHKGVFITTSDFAETARAYAKNLPQKVILIDGDRLAELMLEHNIGVSLSHSYEIKRIDSDYFEES